MHACDVHAEKFNVFESACNQIKHCSTHEIQYRTIFGFNSVRTEEVNTYTLPRMCDGYFGQKMSILPFVFLAALADIACLYMFSELVSDTNSMPVEEIT